MLVPDDDDAPPRRPSEAFLLADIDRSAEYRKEYYKYALGIATALLAFTISFQPTLRVAPVAGWLELVGWAGLGLSIAAGVRVHMVWSKFYAAFQKYDNKGKQAKGDAVRKRCNGERHFLETAQLVCLILGVAGVVAFTSINLKNVAIKSDEKPVAPVVTIQATPALLPAPASTPPPKDGRGQHQTKADS